MAGLNTQRHNTATRIRHNCASILGVSETDLLKSNVRRDLFREEIGWVSEARVYSSVDVPILHKDWRGQYALSSVFLNPKLMGVSFHSSFNAFHKVHQLSRSTLPSFAGQRPESTL